jgi:hypothetical protein
MANDKQNFQMSVPAPMVWSAVVEPRPERPNPKDPRAPFKAAYEATWLLTAAHPDWEPLRQMLRENCPEVHAANPYPVLDGDVIANQAVALKKDREWARGKILFKAKCNVKKLDGSLLIPPRLVVLLNGKFVNYDTTDAPRQLAAKFFYSGVLAIGTFHIQGYEGMGGGVSAYLNEVLSLNTGDRIAGGMDPEERYGSPDSFARYTGHVSNISPTAGAPVHGLV